MPRSRPRTLICETCGRVETFQTAKEMYDSAWGFCEGDICPQCHADNVKNHRTNQDADRDERDRQREAKE